MSDWRDADGERKDRKEEATSSIYSSTSRRNLDGVWQPIQTPRGHAA